MKIFNKVKTNNKAVSAVIGVILMVAITVAIAATVYVYVTGFGSSTVPTPSISIGQDAALSNNNVNFTIDSASNDAKWSDIELVVNNTDLGVAAAASPPTNDWSHSGSDDTVSAGETIWINHADVVAGNKVQLVHVPSNSVIVEKTLY